MHTPLQTDLCILVVLAVFAAVVLVVIGAPWHWPEGPVVVACVVGVAWWMIRQDKDPIA